LPKYFSMVRAFAGDSTINKISPLRFIYSLR
jgi:hypothetical protein